MTAGEDPIVPTGQEAPAASGPPPGEELRRAREARGWPVERVAERLRLRAEQIVALERDDHSAFPALIFVSGYVRNYARLLGIDAAPLLASLQPVEAATPVIRAESAAPRRRLSSGLGAFGGLVLGLVLIAAVTLIWFGLRDRPSSAPVDDTPRSAAPALPSPSTAAEEEAGPFDPEAMEEVREELLREEEAAPAAVADEPAAAAATDELVLRFSGMSWIEIADASGRRLAVRMGQAGEELRLRGRAPFDVLLGNAPNVGLEYNGRPYTDIPVSRQNVANFRLGSASE